MILLKKHGTFFFLSVLFVFFLGLIALRLFGMSYTLYDVGIFHQIFWSLSHGEGYWSSLSRAGNFLTDHFSPSLALGVPVYWLLGGSPFALAVIHAACLVGGIAGWVRLASRFPAASESFRYGLVVFTLIFSFFFVSLWNTVLWGFHENLIFFALMPWALAQLYLRQPVSGFILLALAGLSKEILLPAVGLAALAWWPGSSRKLKSASLVFCVLAFAVFLGFELAPHPADKNYFTRYYAYLGSSVSEVAMLLIQHPFEFISRIYMHIGIRQELLYLRDAFGAWLFLPILLPVLMVCTKSGQVARVLLLLSSLLPSFLSAALSTNGALRNGFFHYVQELWPVQMVLFFEAIVFLEKRAKNLGIYLGVLVLALQALLWGSFVASSSHYFVADYYRALSMGQARHDLQAIDPEAKVFAVEEAGPWVTSRRWVHRWRTDARVQGGVGPETDFFTCADVRVRRVDTPSFGFVIERNAVGCSKRVQSVPAQ